MSKQITIVGGGITGLSAAYLAARKGYSVRVVEGAKSFGGLLSTFEVGGTRLEHYYHHFFTHDAEIQWLIHELDVDSKLSFSAAEMGVFRDQRLYGFSCIADLLRFSPMRFTDKVRFGLTSAYLGKMASWRSYENVSALAWFRKYAGKTTTESLWKPMIQVKFGPHAEDLPLAWMIGRLRQRMNSRSGDREKFGYLKGSLDVLLQALLVELKKLGVEMISDAPVEEFDIEGEVLNGIRTARGAFQDGIFLVTVPNVILPRLVERTHPKYAQELSKIAYFGAVCTVLEMNQPISNVYWMNIADPGFSFGGLIEHTNWIPSSTYGGSRIVYLSRYFSLQESFAKLSNDQIADQMVSEIRRIQPAFRPNWIKNRFVFRTNTAATVCDLGFSRKVPACKSPIRNLFLANMSHVYPDERSVNNSIRVAAEACHVMGIDASDVPRGSSLSGQIHMSR